MASYAEPPPPYLEVDPAMHYQYNNPEQFRISRKPISTVETRPVEDQYRLPVRGRSQVHDGDAGHLQPIRTIRPMLSLQTLAPPPPLMRTRTNSPAGTYSSQPGTPISGHLSPGYTYGCGSRPGTPGSAGLTSGRMCGAGTPISPGISSRPSTSCGGSTFSVSPAKSFESQSSQSSNTSFIQTAYREARHFAGGLLSHPSESTKHYTVLRHSHGLVFYQGNSTSLAISIFADQPLPQGRTLWLQSKGWSGNTGMRARAFMGMNSSWLNVTPTTLATVEQLKPTDERAWQRDITSFQKKTSRDKRKTHILRETAIVRIPVEAGDGYFQLVLCLEDKKKVLCTSPCFRVFSATTDPSSIKGASLATLPLEIGAMVATQYAQKTVGRFVGPAASLVQGRVKKFMPSAVVQGAATKAYDKLKPTLEDANKQYDLQRSGSYLVVAGGALSLDYGPEPPYPISFTGQNDLGTRYNTESFSIPGVHLADVPAAALQQLHGYYFGWCRVHPRQDKSIPISDMDDTWYQVIISALPVNIAQLARVDFAQASKKTITVRLFRDYTPTFPEGTAIKVRVMGFIRPDEPAQRMNLERGIQAGDEDAIEAAMLSEFNDISTAQGVLDCPAWGPEGYKERDAQADGMDKLKNGLAGVRMAAQRQIDRVPVHKLGLRLPVDAMKDRAMLTNGFYVQR